MKHYKFLIPLLLVVLFGASVYSLSGEKVELKQEYNQYLEQARECREQGIQVDALSFYNQALTMEPSLDLSLEIGDYYLELEDTDEALSWGESLVESYPKESKAYEFLMDLYLNTENYVSCYQLYDKFADRELSSEAISKTMSQIDNLYYFSGEYQNVGAYSSGLCPVQSDDLWGYVDQGGSQVVQTQFSKAGPFSETLAGITDAEGNSYFIDSAGNKKRVVQGVSAKELGMICGGIFPLYDGGKWGYYNLEENKHLFGEYDQVSALQDGIAAVKEGETWSLVNSNGEKISSETYDGVILDEKQCVSSHSRIFVEKSLSFQMLDASGNPIGNQTFDDARLFIDDSGAAVKVGEVWGFIDTNGNWQMEAQYQNARSFSNGLAAVQIDGKWGFIDREGKVIIEAVFDDAKDFTSSGTVFVCEDGVWKLLKLYKYNH